MNSVTTWIAPTAAGPLPFSTFSAAQKRLYQPELEKVGAKTYKSIDTITEIQYNRIVEL